jgi:drug/metabolite transporter (DMT)-like permease
MISPPMSKIAPILAIFFVFFTIQPLLMRSMQNAGVPNKKIDYSWITFIFMLPNYYAMIPVGFLPSKSTLADMTRKEWKTCSFLSCMDLANQLMSKVGLMMTGAGVYILINSSGMIWTVVLSRFILGKRASNGQLAGIMLVFMGLCLKVLDSAKAKTDEKSSTEMYGIGIIVAASILDALVFVLVEKFQQGPAGIPGPQLTCMQGMVASAILTIWTLWFTLSGANFENYILNGVRLECENEAAGCIAHNGRTILYCLYFLFMANVFTSSTVWWLLANVGAVTFVVVKALKILLVFGSAHVLYCSKDEGECMTNTRVGCCALVVCGVICYSLAPKKSHDDTDLDGEEDEKEKSIVAGDAAGLSFMSHGSVHRSRAESALSRRGKADGISDYQACA